MATFGSFALLLALALSVYELFAGSASLLRRQLYSDRLGETARRAGIAVFVALSASAVALVVAAFQNDFSISYIFRHSNIALPAPYKFAVLWSGQEGSLLFWAWLLAAFGFLVRLRHKVDARLVAHASVVLAAVQIFFLLLVNFAAHPFAVVQGQMPADGNGLNPLLQYPEMVIHPPMLYLGYVGFTVPFAFALGALIMRYPGEKWIHITRRWTMVTWCFLTIGIFLGGHWAYSVLGWGGYWGWDPVENASLLPWLTGTAFLHSVMMQEKRGMLKVWNIWLIFGTFSDETPDFESYIGKDHVANIRRICGRPITVLGQYSQMLHSNWKLYIENVQDPYHASLLHAFNGVMKMDRLTMEGGINMGTGGWHHISYSKMTVDPGGEIYETAPLRSAEISAYGYGLRDRSLTDVWDDYGDRISLSVQTVFPTFVLQQLRNCLAFRTAVPRGPRATELMWIAFGYADDDEARKAKRLKQSNMMGPSGLISMEDGMVGALIQKSIEGDKDKSSVMLLGGRGTDPIEGSRASEGSVRGFWAGYRALTGL